MSPLNPVAVAHRFARSVITEGDRCVDATLGNGHDTEFLARLVGRQGKVLGLDVQDKALSNTRIHLNEAGLTDRVLLVKAGHETLEGQLQQLGWPSTRLVMFNLGYLPGSDKTVVTRPETTIRALDTCVKYLEAGGAISLVVYRGHSGGEAEYSAVKGWVAGLDRESWFSLKYERGSAEGNRTPVFFWLRKRS